jgi:hypothetical protein
MVRVHFTAEAARIVALRAYSGRSEVDAVAKFYPFP